MLQLLAFLPPYLVGCKLSIYGVSSVCWELWGIRETGIAPFFLELYI